MDVPSRSQRRRRRRPQPTPDWEFEAYSDFDYLPDELLAIVFQKLDVPSLLQVGKVCKRFHNVSDLNLVWQCMDESYVKKLCTMSGNALDDKRFDEARLWLKRLLSLDPKHSCGLQNTAYLLEVSGQREESLVWYDKVLQLNPLDPTAYRNKCEILFVFKRFDDLLQLTEKWLSLKPNCYEGLYWKAVALMSLKRHDELVHWIDQSLADDPMHIQFLSNKGLALFDQQKYSEALVWFERVLAIDHKDLNAMINKAATLRKLRRFKKALKWCDKALDLCDSKKHFFCFYEKYAVLLDMKKLEDASAFLDVIRENFGDPVQEWYLSQKEELVQVERKAMQLKLELGEKKRAKRKEKRLERKLAEKAKSLDLELMDFNNAETNVVVEEEAVSAMEPVSNYKESITIRGHLGNMGIFTYGFLILAAVIVFIQLATQMDFDLDTR